MLYRIINNFHLIKVTVLQTYFLKWNKEITTLFIESYYLKQDQIFTLKE